MMRLVPVDVSAITRGVETLLKGDIELLGANVERCAEINKDPALCPWIGIYKSMIEYPHRGMGAPDNIAGLRSQETSLLLIVQHSDGKGGAECEDLLEGLLQKILTTLLSNRTLGGVVETVDQFVVRYPQYQITAKQRFMQTAFLFFTALGGTSIE